MAMRREAAARMEALPLVPVNILPTAGDTQKSLNIGAIIGGLESVDIPYGLRKTAAEARCVRPPPAVWKKKSAYR